MYLAFITLLVAVTKYLTKSNGRKEGSHGSRNTKWLVITHWQSGHRKGTEVR